MPVIYKRPTSISAIWSRRIGFFALLLIGTVWAMHRFGSFSTPESIAVGLVASAVAAFGLGLAMIGLSMLWFIGAKGGKASFVGLCLNLLALIPIGISTYRYVSLPQIYDVATTEQPALEWIKPPATQKSWLPDDASGEILFDLKNTRIYSQLTPRRYRGAIDRVYGAVRDVIRSEKFTVVASQGDDFFEDLNEPDPTNEDTENEEGAQTAPVPTPAPTPAPRPADGENDAEFELLQTFDAARVRVQLRKSSFILGLNHDVMILITEDETSTFVEMRSAIKHGPHDLGLNAALMNRFLSRLDDTLSGIVGVN